MSIDHASDYEGLIEYEHMSDTDLAGLTNFIKNGGLDCCIGQIVMTPVPSLLETAIKGQQVVSLGSPGKMTINHQSLTFSLINVQWSYFIEELALIFNYIITIKGKKINNLNITRKGYGDFEEDEIFTLDEQGELCNQHGRIIIP